MGSIDIVRQVLEITLVMRKSLIFLCSSLDLHLKIWPHTKRGSCIEHCCFRGRVKVKKVDSQAKKALLLKISVALAPINCYPSMPLYRSMVYCICSSMYSSGFPILKSIL